MPRTPGDVKTDGNLFYILNKDGCNRATATHNFQNGQGCTREEMLSNVRTHTIAHRAANKIDAMGFDGDKAIEKLPKYIEWLADEKIDDFDRAAFIHEFMALISEKDDE